MIKNFIKNKIRVLCLFSWLVFFLSFGIRIYFSNKLVSNTLLLSNLYSQKNELELKISKISYEISEMSSLNNIENRAKTLGFNVYQNQVFSINPYSSVPLASLPSQ